MAYIFDENDLNLLDENGLDIEDEGASVLLKNVTLWQPNQVKGQIFTPGLAFMIDQSGNFLVDKSHDFLVTTPSYVTGLNQTIWTETPPS